MGPVRPLLGEFYNLKFPRQFLNIGYTNEYVSTF